MFGGHDRYLESAAGRLLRDAATAGRVRVAVPEVVLTESDANYRRAVAVAEADLRAARTALQRLRAPQGGDLQPRRLRYRADLESVLREAGAEILPIPNVPHERLIAKAVVRRRPFNEAGSGYRDALVWESILDLLERSQGQIVLISNDRTAFAEKKGTPRLANGLLRELRERRQAGRVKLYFQLSDFTTLLPETQDAVASWQQLLRGGSERAEALKSYLLKVALEDAPTVIGDSNLAPNVRNARFLSFSNPRDPRVNDVWVAADDETTILDLDLVADYSQEFEARLPDATAPPGMWTWVEMTEESSIGLSFEVIQHPDAEFGGQLIDWWDPQDDFPAHRSAR